MRDIADARDFARRPLHCVSLPCTNRFAVSMHWRAPERIAAMLRILKRTGALHTLRMMIAFGLTRCRAPDSEGIARGTQLGAAWSDTVRRVRWGRGERREGWQERTFCKTKPRGDRLRAETLSHRLLALAQVLARLLAQAVLAHTHAGRFMFDVLACLVKVVHRLPCRGHEHNRRQGIGLLRLRRRLRTSAATLANHQARCEAHNQRQDNAQLRHHAENAGRLRANLTASFEGADSSLEAAARAKEPILSLMISSDKLV